MNYKNITLFLIVVFIASLGSASNLQIKVLNQPSSRVEVTEAAQVHKATQQQQPEHLTLQEQKPEQTKSQDKKIQEHEPQEEKTQLPKTQEQKASQPKTQSTQESKAEKILKDIAIGGAVGGTAAGAVSLGSAAAISTAGFTTSGIAAGSIAASVQSGIGLVGAGTNFAALQSLGALGQGIFGFYALPVIVGAVVIGGGGYMAYQYFSQNNSTSN